MTRDEKIRHWLQAAQVAAEVMEFCMAQVARELGEGTVLVELDEPPTVPIRPLIPG
jgi:hypothetical protein